MYYTHLQVQILNGLNQLAEVVPCKCLRKRASFIFDFNEAEKVSLLDQLQDDEENLNLFARLLYNNFSLLRVVLY